MWAEWYVKIVMKCKLVSSYFFFSVTFFWCDFEATRRARGSDILNKKMKKKRNTQRRCGNDTLVVRWHVLIISHRAYMSILNTIKWLEQTSIFIWLYCTLYTTICWCTRCIQYMGFFFSVCFFVDVRKGNQSALVCLWCDGTLQNMYKNIPKT